MIRPIIFDNISFGNITTSNKNIKRTIIGTQHKNNIDSISLNFDTFASGRINTWRTEIIEAKLEGEDKASAYKFLDECDTLINRIRIPRGKLRNMVRKQRKQVDEKLMEVTTQFNEIFKEIQDITSEYKQKL